MAHHGGKLEHSGPKRGRGAFWGRKVDAKHESTRRRRKWKHSKGDGFETWTLP